MGNVMDNCCTCGGGGRLHAAVNAVFRWPGWAPFTTGSLGGPDTLGVRYLTATVTINKPGGGTISKSLTADSLNGTMTDLVTGTDAEADGPWPGFGLKGGFWPPDSISPDGTTATWATGEQIV